MFLRLLTRETWMGNCTSKICFPRSKNVSCWIQKRLFGSQPPFPLQKHSFFVCSLEKQCYLVHLVCTQCVSAYESTNCIPHVNISHKIFHSYSHVRETLQRSIFEEAPLSNKILQSNQCYCFKLMFFHSFIRSFVSPSVRQSVRPSVYSFVRPFICPFTCSFVLPFVRALVPSIWALRKAKNQLLSEMKDNIIFNNCLWRLTKQIWQTTPQISLPIQQKDGHL